MESGIFGIIALVLGLVFYIWLPARMAEDRGRSPLAWIVVSIIISPILAILLLLLFGNAETDAE